MADYHSVSNMMFHAEGMAVGVLDGDGDRQPEVDLGYDYLRVEIHRKDDSL